jgi:hypothetical protein
MSMKKMVVELANAVFWDPAKDDKVYLDNVQGVITEFPFHTRQVVLRFARGPKLDLSIVDMDRIAIEYFKLRGIELPANVSDLANANPPPKCDFVVPSHLMRELAKTKDSPDCPAPSTFATGKRRKQNNQASRTKRKNKLCARCRRRSEPSGDWYGDLCPRCADQTEGEWVCKKCGRHGDFDTMGGSGSVDPVCCGSPCKHIRNA